MLRCWSFLAYTPTWPVALFLLLLHPPGILYLLTFDCAKTFSLSNATWKPIYSNSLSPPVLDQAPLYLRTWRRYTNPLLLLLLIRINPETWIWIPGHFWLRLDALAEVCAVWVQSSLFFAYFTASQTKLAFGAVWCVRRADAVLSFILAVGNNHGRWDWGRLQGGESDWHQGFCRRIYIV